MEIFFATHFEKIRHPKHGSFAPVLVSCRKIGDNVPDGIGWYTSRSAPEGADEAILREIKRSPGCYLPEKVFSIRLFSEEGEDPTAVITAVGVEHAKIMLEARGWDTSRFGKTW